MTEIINEITTEDVIWTMPWTKYMKKDGTPQYPGKEDEEKFEEEKAIAHLLVNEVIGMNTFWHMKDWPEAAQKATYFYVNCNDVFAWGCSDAENLDLDDLEELYRMWLKDPSRGADVWCIINRKQLPQRPVLERIKNGGIWDMDALKEEHGLRPNYYDGVSRILAEHKYNEYSDWARSLGNEPVPFDANWWVNGWAHYTAAHPDWYSPEWTAQQEMAMKSWRAKNGYA